jgi:hypothetical protein
MRQHLASFALLSVGLVACIPRNDDPDPGIRTALPTADQMKIKLPENASAKPGDKALGDLAAWYVATRDVTRSLNGGTAWVLILVHTIVQFPPTTTEANTYTWGPWSGDALDPANYRLVVTALDNGTYDWSLDGDTKRTAAEDFETIISGNATPGATEATGHGDFTIDFDAAERVNPVDNDGKGVVSIVYDLAAAHLDIAIDTTADDNVTPVHADYAYQAQADGSGDMVFAVHGDTDDAGSLPEDAVVRSRWEGSGAGRADVRLSGGDLADQQVTASQCWDGTFGEVYYSDSATFLPTEGDEAACAYQGVDLPPL